MAFDNSVVQLLVSAARIEKEFLYMKTEVGDLLASITLKVSSDLYGVAPIQLTAEQVSDGSDEWRIVDYW